MIDSDQLARIFAEEERARQRRIADRIVAADRAALGQALNEQADAIQAAGDDHATVRAQTMRDAATAIRRAR